MIKENHSVAAYFPEITEDQIAKLHHYVEVLLETNETLNLISRKNTDQVWENHIIHALSILKLDAFRPGNKILDFGTGGGLPGVPLAICNPDCDFLLVDSIGKKVKAVQRMVEEIGLTNVRTRHCRVEEIKETFDFSVSRAVTSFDKMDDWLKGKIRPGKESDIEHGFIYIKGGDFEEDLLELDRRFKVWRMSDWFSEPFFETKKLVWVETGS